MAGQLRSPVRVFLGFTWRVTAVHILTYMVIGGLSYWLVAKRFWAGPEAVPGLRDPQGEFVQQWFLPAQILRGILHAIVFIPFRRLLLEMKRWGGLVVASVLLLIGSVGGISGLIESVVYSTTWHLGLILAHLPEIVVQTLLFGYILLWWERRVEARHPSH